MMKILYGVQGTGNGHIARARVMAGAFSQRNDVEVDFVFSGRQAQSYFDMECFGEYRAYEGLSFVTRSGKIDNLSTLRNVQAKQLFGDILHIDLSGYDLVLNDFEPVSAWAAKRQGVMSISMSHQAAFDYRVPKKNQSLLDKAIMKWFAPSDLRLGVHWYHFDHPILPPFVIEKPDSSPGNKHTLVYLPFESVDDIQSMLSPIRDHRFVCFHPDILSPVSNEHVNWQPLSKPNFSSHLRHCNGVIGNGGFELSSEALQLGKKLLLKALDGQFEQASNVFMLEKLGLCQSFASLHTDTVEEWLSAPDGEAIIFPDDPHPLIDWILKKEWQTHQGICQYFWQKVKFPEKTQSKLLALQTSTV